MVKKFAAFDIDGTVIRWQLYHGIADAMAKEHLITPKNFSLVRQARMHWKKRGGDDAFREYEDALIVAFDSGFAGLDEHRFDVLVQRVFEEYKEQVYTYTRELIKQLKKQGYILFAISGSPEIIVQKFVEHYGFDDFVGTAYEKKNGIYTGAKDISLGRKPELLQLLIDKHNANLQHSLAIGDTESDIGMLEIVEQPIAFNPSKKLFKVAQSQGWKIVVERKNMVYELEANGDTYQLANTNS